MTRPEIEVIQVENRTIRAMSDELPECVNKQQVGNTPKLLSTAIPRSKPHPETTRLTHDYRQRKRYSEAHRTINFRCNNPRLTFLVFHSVRTRERSEMNVSSIPGPSYQRPPPCCGLVSISHSEFGELYLLLLVVATYIQCQHGDLFQKYKS
jgi:hypothetical protein